MTLNPELQRRAKKLARQVIGALQASTPGYKTYDLIEAVKEEVGKLYCLLCFKKFEKPGDSCYCGPEWDD